MSGTRAKTIAISFIPLILVSSSFGIYLAFTPSSTTTTMNYPLTASTVNSTSGLELFLSVNSSSITYGSGINVTVGLLNMKSVNLTLSYPGPDWLPVVTTFCPGIVSFAILQGYYDVNNVSSFNPTQRLNIFPALEGCPDNGGQIVLPPNGGYATAPPYGQQASYELSGYYPTSRLGPPAAPFPVGTYTIVAGDGWGQIAILHFIVLTHPLSSYVTNSSVFTVGSANFSTSSWQYAGNVTLAGSLSICYVLRLPCPNNPQNQAEEFASANGTIAFVETANGCGSTQGCMTTTIVLIDDTLYCVSPKSNIPSQPECPALIV